MALKRLLPFFAGIVLLVAGCRQEPQSKPRSEFTAIEVRGDQLFMSECAVCHRASSDQALNGPGLKGLMQKKYLPSGAPANDDRVRQTILYGRGNMPPFCNMLDDRQVTDLLAYLHTL